MSGTGKFTTRKNPGGSKPRLKLCFYADDFTGSTDVLEQLALVGVRAMLFIQAPTPRQLVRYPGIEAVGVAGRSRSMSPREMEVELTPAFKRLKKLGAPHVHYKVCSTFDSAPNVGSIGCAIDIGAKIFKKRFLPVVAGAPRLGRYCAFGNLFARFGIGTKGAFYRLDRHPSISKHPITPMNEADLVLHLGRQTRQRIGLMDYMTLGLPLNDALWKLVQLTINEGKKIVLLDLMEQRNLPQIGALMDSFASSRKPLFSVGSSGVEAALGAFWRGQKSGVSLPRIAKRARPVHPILVASGSCSPVTIAQIRWALRNGFAEVKLNAKALMQPRLRGREILNACEAVAEQIARKRSVVIHTDPAKRIASAHTGKLSEILGRALGIILRETLAVHPLHRVCIAGGDTAGYVSLEMGIESLQLSSLLSPGAPICRAIASDSPADGLEMVYKGGQVGAVDFFGVVAKGTAKKIERR